MVHTDLGAEVVYYMLMSLEKKGYITRFIGSAAWRQLAAWTSMGVDAGVAAERLKETRVGTVAIGDVSQDSDDLRVALTSLGLRCGPLEDADIVVAVVDDYLRQAIAVLNSNMVHARREWLIVKPLGQTVWVGPLFTPIGGACWECLARCLTENRAEQLAAIQGASEPAVISRAALPPTRVMAVNCAATEVAKWVVSGRSDSMLRNTVLTINPFKWELRTHNVLQHLECPVCGQNDSASLKSPAGSRLQLASTLKRFTADGGHRVCHPDETLRRLERFVSPITGIIPELLKDTSVQGANVYFANHVSALAGADRSRARLGNRWAVVGKGATDVQARVSCLAEAMERYNARFRGSETRMSSRLAELGEEAVSPDRLLMFSENQYATRHLTNGPRHTFNWVPVRYDEAQAIDWTPCWSLTAASTRWVPTAYCYFDYPLPEHECFCRADSNGCASGNTLEEAVLQGLLELVERDSVGLWWYNRVPRPAIDLGSFHDRFFVEAESALRSGGRSLVALDLTSDVCIPVVAAVSWDAKGERIMIGLGAHLEPRIAVSRAISELCQMLALSRRVAALDSLPRSQRELYDPAVSKWLADASLANQRYILPLAGEPRDASMIPDISMPDLRDDIYTCVRLIKNLGMETLVLDLTRPENGFPTARVIVPGLRHFWARLAPGRLYDTPVKLGWLSQALSEDELNPVAFFL